VPFRRRAAVGAVVVLLTLVALLVVRGMGKDGDDVHDLGEQSDASAMGRAVEGRLAQGQELARGEEARSTCAPQTRATYGRGLGPLVYTGKLRWNGVPAVALAYRVADSRGRPLDYRLFVMSMSGCELLVTQSL
jgi:hypothetical protein